MDQQNRREPDGLTLDVAIIGAGFAGLYSLHKMRNELGLDAESFDDAAGVGGTWYWNRYPGCRTDTQASVYSYSFDRALVAEWEWSERYPTQPEVLRYLNAVADKHDLRRSIRFNTRIRSAKWMENEGRWHLETTDGARIRARFVIEGVGLLSSTNTPAFPGMEKFSGTILHAARWPSEPVDFSGKRVAVLGTGSTGIQLVSALAGKAGHLFVCQRTPQYVVPARNGPIDGKTLEWMRSSYESYHAWVMNSATVFGIEEATTPAMSVAERERKRVYEAAWQRGGGFAFMLGTFGDLTFDQPANDTATDFSRGKIREIVRDQAVAEKLSPTDFYAKRPLCADGYYEAFNRPDVTLVDLRTSPLERITERGIETSDGEIELDVIILATGFDAFTGNYLKIETVGRNGETLQEKWKNGPRAYMGVATAGFPNLFTVFGPFSPFTSQPMVDEFQVDWIAGLIERALADGIRSVEVDRAAEDAWIETCETIAEQTLFAVTDSWINGANVPGKPRRTMIYMGGMANYAQLINAVSAGGYKEFKLETARSASKVGVPG